MSAYWTNKQVAVLRNNPSLDADRLRFLVNEVGPERSLGAVRDMRHKLGIHRERGCATLKGWPVMINDHEWRDREFVRMVLQEGFRLGRLRDVS